MPNIAYLYKISVLYNFLHSSLIFFVTNNERQLEKISMI